MKIDLTVVSTLVLELPLNSDIVVKVVGRRNRFSSIEPPTRQEGRRIQHNITEYQRNLRFVQLWAMGEDRAIPAWVVKNSAYYDVLLADIAILML